MSVYVDNARHWHRGLMMCHMIADSTAELFAMVDKIGVQRKWIQKKGTEHEHFDICLTKRKLAVEAGAKEITMHELGELLLARRKAKTA